MYVWLAGSAVVLALGAYVFARLKAGQRARRLPGIVLPFAALSLLTVVFDNIMISLGLFGYGPGALLGAYIGVMPIEDLAYPAVAVLLIAALGGPSDR
ncbi:MAG: hypothetical protein RL672_889 [Actinomycetota bacterium]|jgi:lycopene cyclase domain-containing protein